MAQQNFSNNVSDRTFQEVEYLKKALGPILVAALAEICIRRPSDPIEYLGHWLLRWRYNEELKRRDVQNAMDVVQQRQWAQMKADTEAMLAENVPEKVSQDVPQDPYATGSLGQEQDAEAQLRKSLKKSGELPKSSADSQEQEKKKSSQGGEQKGSRAEGKGSQAEGKLSREEGKGSQEEKKSTFGDLKMSKSTRESEASKKSMPQSDKSKASNTTDSSLPKSFGKSSSGGTGTDDEVRKSTRASAKSKASVSRLPDAQTAETRGASEAKGSKPSGGEARPSSKPQAPGIDVRASKAPGVDAWASKAQGINARASKAPGVDARASKAPGAEPQKGSKAPSTEVRGSEAQGAEARGTKVSAGPAPPKASAPGTGKESIAKEAPRA